MTKKHPAPQTDMRLINAQGQRLYCNGAERARFLAAARHAPPHILALAEVLHDTGCRVSELLDITPQRIDLDGGTIIFQTLKKRRRDVFRAVPVSPGCLAGLERTFSIRKAQTQRRKRHARLWPITRVRVWQIVTALMQQADIAEGPHRTPKGLRHGYGIHAVSSGVPITSVQKWMGHAQLSTTAIYVDFCGAEATDLAARMWG